MNIDNDWNWGPPHWPNPYRRAIPIPLRCLALMTPRQLSPKAMVEVWREEYGDQLDAYILPQPSGWHCIGLRYGPNPEDYLSLTMRDEVYQCPNPGSPKT